MRENYRPLNSLQAGCWFKLICGASYQDLPSIRNLALAYALAGADCIDVAADPAVVAVVKESFGVVSRLQQSASLSPSPALTIPAELPLLMVSFSDGDDPHFRKAQFDSTLCPTTCPRPCEAICPAAAIAFNDSTAGVLEDRCYGCGRCLPVCPTQQIETVTRATAVSAIAPTLLSQVDAIEIHTQVGRYADFMALWSVIRPHLAHLKVISISCPDHEGAIAYFWQLYEGIQPLPIPLIWQTDGRPMSGDIGKGTTHATLRFAQKVLQSGPPGFVQLAGGTNAHTVDKLQAMATARQNYPGAPPPPAHRVADVDARPTFGGVAYGSFARRLLSPVLETFTDSQAQPVSTSSISPPLAYDLNHLPSPVDPWLQAVQLAHSLVAPLKATASELPLPLLSPGGDRFSSLATHAEPPSYSSLFE